MSEQKTERDVDSLSEEDVLEHLNPRQQLFCKLYAENYNASKSARLSGYSAKTAQRIGSENLSKPLILRYVRILRNRRAAELDLSDADLIATWALIVTADPSEVVEYRRGACRYCHGTNHAYKWRTPREFEKAHGDYMLLCDAKQAASIEPLDQGGFGYKRTLGPHPECPECDGMGQGFQYLHDTRTLSPQGKALYRGTQTTKDGIKVFLADQEKALEQLSKINGIYDQPDAGKTASAIGTWLNDLRARGSKPPVKSDP